MDNNKKLIVGFIAIVAFLYVVFSLNSLLLEVSDTSVCSVAGTAACPHKEQVDFLIGAIPIIASIALIAGAGTYYLMAGKVESKEKSLKSNTEVLLKFLNEDERKLVNAIIESEGKVLQAEITRLPGMTKVKSHRIVQRLIDRGVIETDKLGKTNIVKFTTEIKEGIM
jgi:uncharacterized membrane protein